MGRNPNDGNKVMQQPFFPDAEHIHLFESIGKQLEVLHERTETLLRRLDARPKDDQVQQQLEELARRLVMLESISLAHLADRLERLELRAATAGRIIEAKKLTMDNAQR